MNDGQIKELQHMEQSHGGILSPPTAQAHVTSYDHYHYFWNGSWVYQYANSWNMRVHLSPKDASMVKDVGLAVASLVGLYPARPLLFGLGAIAAELGYWRFTDSNGNLDIYIPAQSVADTFGYIYHYYGSYPYIGWWYYYSSLTVRAPKSCH